MSFLGNKMVLSSANVRALQKSGNFNKMEKGVEHQVWLNMEDELDDSLMCSLCREEAHSQ